MPVRKFRSIEDMNAAQATPLDPDNLRLAISLSRTCFALDPRRMPRGVRKYRSVEEAWAARVAWEQGAK